MLIDFMLRNLSPEKSRVKNSEPETGRQQAVKCAKNLPLWSSTRPGLSSNMVLPES